MEKKMSFMSFMTDKFAPKANEIMRIPILAAMGEAWVKIVPFILVASLSSLVTAIAQFIPGMSWLPSLSWLSGWTYDLAALMVAFIMPYLYFEKKDKKQCSLCAGITGMIVLLIFINPLAEFDPTTFSTSWILSKDLLGGTGSFLATIASLFVIAVYSVWLKLNVFGKIESLPDFVLGWFNNMIPIAILIIVAKVAIVDMQFDIVSFSNNLFAPFFNFGQTYIGFMCIVMIPVFFYSCGISVWAWSAAFTPILNQGISENAANIAAGLAATNIATKPTLYSMGLLSMGGTGCTLTLVLLMVFVAKSKKLKNLGKIFLVPSVFNINEPVIYGAPIVFNPFLMIPMWIVNFVVGTITYVVMKVGLLNIPAQAVQLGQLPAPFNTVITSGDMRGILWYVVVFVVSMAIWYPFFKAYDKQCVTEEGKGEE